MSKEINASLTQHRIFMESLKIEIDSINTKINEFFRQLENLHKKADLPSDFLAFKIDANERLSRLEYTKFSHQEDLSSQRKEQGKTREMIDQLTSVVEKVHPKINHYKYDSDVKISAISQDFDRLKERIDRTVAHHQDSVKRNMQDFKQSLEASPASILETNEEVAKNLDETMRGLANAMQGINHHYALMTTLERKLNSFDVRLKTLEAK